MQASVLIPTRNSIDRLLYTLQSFNLQFTPFENFEVLVIDHGSIDETVNRVAAFPSHYSLKMIRKLQINTYGQLLKAGVKESKGNILIFCGDNLIVPRHFIGTHVQAHRQEEKLVFTGIGWRRIYSVYDPTFTPQQKQECQQWLENYPQIKRPYCQTKTIPLLEENMLTHDFLYDIGLPSFYTNKYENIAKNNNNKRMRHFAPWTLCRTKHLSIQRKTLNHVKDFALWRGNARRFDKILGQRLSQLGCSLHLSEKLVLLQQEEAVGKF